MLQDSVRREGARSLKKHFETSTILQTAYLLSHCYGTADLAGVLDTHCHRTGDQLAMWVHGHGKAWVRRVRAGISDH